MTIVLPENGYSAALLAQLEQAAEGIPHTVTDRLDGLTGKVLFAVALDECGCNDGYYRMLRRLRGDPELLRGCTAGQIGRAHV